MDTAMHLAMHPEMIYGYSIWAIACLVIGLALLGAWIIEGCARRFVRLELRTAHNAVAGAMVGTIGTTYAVLLAFVAMLAWESFNKAATVSHAEAAAIGDVAVALVGLSGPEVQALHTTAADYAHAVIEVEFPAHARGEPVQADSAAITRLNALAASLRPQTAAETNLHARLLQTIWHLADTRAERVRIAGETIPTIIWTTLLMGGALTVVAASFLGAPSVLIHLAMSSALALSGALVLVLIVALSNPFRGDFRVSDAPYRQVLDQLQR